MPKAHMSRTQVEEIIKNTIIKKGYANIKKEKVTYIITKKGHVSELFNYRSVVLNHKDNPNDAYIYANVDESLLKVDFYYPSNYFYKAPLNAYLSKRGFMYGDSIFPLPNLKYIVNVIKCREYFSVEILDIDIVAENLNLPRIVSESKDYGEIYRMYWAQKFFKECRYDIDPLIGFVNCSGLLWQRDPHIIELYDSVFQPYKVFYYMDYHTKDLKKVVDC